VQVGDLVTGKVTRWLRFGALVAIDDGPEGLLHMDGLSGAPMEEVEAVGLDSVLPLGERIRALVVKMALTKGRVGLSTKALDKNPGDMLTNRQAVFDGAEEMAARWRERQTAEDAAEGRTPQQKAVKVGLEDCWCRAAHACCAAERILGARSPSLVMHMHQSCRNGCADVHAMTGTYQRAGCAVWDALAHHRAHVSQSGCWWVASCSSAYHLPCGPVSRRRQPGHWRSGIPAAFR
jgi:predicted RNA-binding protein with RPS1 domain